MISIIIPTKNEEKYLPKLLESIKLQNYKDLEIIIADAGSTDKTKEIAKSYGCKIVGGGTPAKGRNQGAKKSKGHILVFIDADLILPQNFLENAIKEFNKKNLDVAGTLQTPISLSKKFKDFGYNFLYEFANKWIRFMQYTTKPCMQICMFVKKEIHNKLNGFDDTIIFGEDSEYAIRAKKIGNFGILEKSDKIKISPRRFEKYGFKLILKDIYFNIGRLFGHEFRAKNGFKYFREESF